MASAAWKRYFYPRSPCGERHFLQSCVNIQQHISIHALLAESDQTGKTSVNVPCHFYPRSPCGERPNDLCIFGDNSIYFYPRSPCGERPAAPLARRGHWPFLSTLSLRRATSSKTHDRHKTAISIHALLAESDAVDVFLAVWAVISIHALLAESDCRPGQNILGALPISIHALLAESDIFALSMAVNLLLFLSTLSLRRATAS